MIPLEVRKAESQDAPAILQLIKELAHFEEEPDAVELTEKDLIRDGFSENPIFTCFIAEENQEIKGMAFIYFRYSTWKGKTVHLEDLIVKKEYRHRGIGTALYKKVMQFALENNVKRVEWVVLDWNKNAETFYRNSGAHILSQWNTVQMDETGIKNYLNQ